MPRRIQEEDWEDDEPDWHGEEDLADSFEDGHEPTVPCPYCLRPVHEDSQRCPHCERYISQEDAPRARRPWWIIIGALLALYVVFRWIVRPP